MIKLRPVTWALLTWSVTLACDEGPPRGARTSTRTAAPADTDRGRPEETAGPARSPETDFPVATGEDPRILIRDTHLRVTRSAVLHVSELLGQLVRLQEAPAYFDEPPSYRIRVERAVVDMTGPSLAGLMNEYVFAYEGSPLSDISIEIRDGRLYQEGTLHTFVSLRVSIVSRVEVTGEGSLRLVPERVKAAGLPVTSLMDLFGVEMDEVLGELGSRGITVVDDDLLLNPEALLPPPTLQGRAESVSLEGGILHLTLARAEGDAISSKGMQPSLPDAPHYLFFKGGEVRFGKLTMRDTDLQIVDAEPSDPFDFYSDRLHDQLVAGSSYTMPDNGLLVKVPDFGDIER